MAPVSKNTRRYVQTKGDVEFPQMGRQETPKMNRNHKRSERVLIQNCGDYFEKHAIGSTQPHPHTP